MIVRLGIPACFNRFSGVAKSLGSPILVSANAFRRDGKFWRPSADLFHGADVALDSAGFVAMFRYRGYPWTQAEYVALAASHPWTWWAAMDFCCEPQIARDRDEVARRVLETAMMLERNRDEAEIQGVKPPMPVLQGWLPEDYLVCAEMMGDLPALVGVGSVCRRPLRGDDGVLAVIAALDRHLPKSVGLHLFGVKGSAIGVLAGHPRITSMDSQAWDRAARWEASKGRFSCSVAHRENHMRRWHQEQIGQLGLFASSRQGVLI
jgi:hypothetical protein